MKIFIQHMVSLRCKMVVKEVIQQSGLQYLSVELGQAEIAGDISDRQYKVLKTSLAIYGLVVIENKKSRLTEKIKNVIIELVHYSDEKLSINFSDYLSKKLQYDYTYLANIFSEVEGITVEKFIICHKIERVKELMLDDDLNLTQIAYKLHYSSVGHLSNQFKKVTGLTPSRYKHLKLKRRLALENICIKQ